MKWLGIGALAAFVGVGLGAFGAHALKAVVPPDRMVVYQTGVQYHLIHALGIALCGLGAERLPALTRVAGLFLAGIVLFSGSLYLLAVTGIGRFGAITPLGGLCFLSGWALLAWAALRGAAPR